MVVFTKKTFFVLIVISIFTATCKEGKKLRFKSEYYPSGTIKRYGLFWNDSLPFGKVYTYYENGKTETTDHYDSSGLLNGESYVYFNTGIIKQKLNYVDNKILGIVSDYDSSGFLFRNCFYFNDVPVGDYYEYKRNGETVYRFYDFENHLINQIEYDSTGNIMTDIRQRVSLDSVSVGLDKTGAHFYKVLVIISNPPQTRNKLFISYLDSSENKIEEDSLEVPKLRYVLQEKKFKSELTKIKFEAIQYDLINRKTKREIWDINIVYEKQ